MLSIFLCLLAGFFLAVHLLTILIAGLRCGARTPAPHAAGRLPPVSVVRPLCGVEPFSTETLAAAFASDYPAFEVLFCVADEADPVIPLVKTAIAAHPGVAARLLVGDDAISGNRKLNNMVKGWREAQHERIAFIDSNVLTPAGFLRGVMATWRHDTGLVTAPPVGVLPEGFGGHLECAFLNTHEARWQYFVDTFGFGFAQGKTLCYRKGDLDRSQMRDLASEPAEDAASTKMVRALGLKVKLAPPSPQPLGRRPIAAVWSRQLRWARLRRITFLGAFLPEILAGIVCPAVCAALAFAAIGWPVAPSLVAYLAVWYAAELVLARSCGWPLGWQTVPAIVLRDLMMPALWIAAFTSRSFTWQGNAVQMEERSRRKKIVAPTLRSGEGI